MKKFYVAGEEILTEKDRDIIIKNKINGMLYNDNIYNAFLNAVLNLESLEVVELFKRFRKYCIEKATAEFNEDYCEIEINLENLPEDAEYMYYNIFNTDEIVFDKEEQIEAIIDNTFDTDEAFKEWINNKYTAYEIFYNGTDEILKEFFDSFYQEAEVIFDKTYAKIDLTKLRAF